MKTLLFSNQGLSPSHLGIELEIIEKELTDGNDVRILYCKSNLESCFFNASHNLLACSICEGRTKVFYDKINFPKKNLHPLKNIVNDFNISEINSIEDIFEIEYKGYEIGRGIAASYISTRRNYEYDTDDLEFIREMGIMCANVVENIESQIATFKPERVILFNGRFAEQNAIIEVCEKHNVDYFTFEKSSAKGKYKFFKNALPHSLKLRGAEIQRVWNQGNPKTRENISKEWFNVRQKGGTGLIKKFLAKQEEGTLPSSFDQKKINIAIFVGSEDEHKAIKEHHFDQYENQNDVIDKTLKHFDSYSNTHFYLRVHPHLRGIDSKQTNEIKAFKNANLTVISAEDPVDSYELMRACNMVLSFGSTTGIEATYIGKPSILFGKSYYQSLDCAYYPKTYPELFKLLKNENLGAKPIENTYPFSYYQSMVGTEFVKFKDEGKVNSTYNGDPINRVYPQTLSVLCRNLGSYKQWRKMNKIIFKNELSAKNMFKLNSHILNEKLR